MEIGKWGRERSGGAEILRLAALAQDDHPHRMVKWKMENRKWGLARTRLHVGCSDAGHPGGAASVASKGVAREGFPICGKQRGYWRNLGSVAKKRVSDRSGKWKLESRKWRAEKSEGNGKWKTESRRWGGLAAKSHGTGYHRIIVRSSKNKSAVC